MPYELLYSPAAAASLDTLEADPMMAKALEAVNDLLDRLEDDPFDRRLGTISFHLAHQVFFREKHFPSAPMQTHLHNA